MDAAGLRAFQVIHSTMDYGVYHLLAVGRHVVMSNLSLLGVVEADPLAAALDDLDAAKLPGRPIGVLPHLLLLLVEVRVVAGTPGPRDVLVPDTHVSLPPSA